MSLLTGIARRWTDLRAGKSEVELRLSHQESLVVAVNEPLGFEMTRAGRRNYLGYSAAPTGIAPVQALPSTAAQWTIWNADQTKTLFFMALGVFPASGTPGVGGQLLATLFGAPAQTGFGTGIAVLNGRGAAASSAVAVKSGVTITTPAAPVWVPIAETGSPNVGAFPGSGVIVNREIQGRIAVPPGYGLGLAVLALAGTTPLFAPIAEWSEVATDCE